jgi:hypothetical protein
MMDNAFIREARKMFPFGPVADAIMLEALFVQWDQIRYPGSFTLPQPFHRRCFVDEMRRLTKGD